MTVLGLLPAAVHRGLEATQREGAPVTTIRVAPLTVIEPARVLRSGDTPGDDSGRRRGRPVAIWALDGTLTRTDTLLPFLRRIAGTRAAVGALAVAAGRELPRRNRRDAGKALVLQRTLGGRPLTEVDRVARGYAARLFAARLRPDALARWSGPTPTRTPTGRCSPWPTSRSA
jgi:phosphatidylglycerophosphatase C